MKYWAGMYLSCALIFGLSFADNAGELQVAQDDYLICFQPVVNSDAVVQIVDRYNLRIVKTYSIVPNLYHVRAAGSSGDQVVALSKTVSMQAFMQQVAQDQTVAFIEPNYVVHEFTLPNDPGFIGLYGMHNTGQTGGTPDADIDAPEAWDIGTGDSTIIVGVIDSGIDYDHPDLAANLWKNSGEIPDNGLDDDNNGYTDDIYGYDFAYGDGDPFDGRGHGTHCAGTIAAVGNNQEGVAGVAWHVKVMALKFLDDYGSGYTSDAVSAIEYAKNMGAHLTSNSWGGGGASNALKLAIENAGLLFVAAAGNESQNNDLVPEYPASYDLDNIISVAANDHNDVFAYFSNYGATSVDLSAPGYSILSTKPDNPTSISFGAPGWGLDATYYGIISGTSMATPHVSGAAALLMSSANRISSIEIKEALMNNVDIIPSFAGKMVSGGRLNVFQALREVAKGLLVSPDSIDFGIVGVTERDSVDLLIRNYTDSEVTLSFSIDHRAYELSHSFVQLNHHESLTLNLLFLPQSEGDFSSTFIIDSGDTTISVPVTGTGKNLPIFRSDISQLKFHLDMNDSSQAQLTLRNTGLADLQWSLPGFLGVQANQPAYPASYDHVAVPKGAEDTRTGFAVQSHQGGPDSSGYRWVDSDVESGLAFDWIDISQTGTEVTRLEDDDFAGPYTIGFPFDYYDETCTEFYIASNGFIGFGPTLLYTSQNNDPLPRPNRPNNILAFLWDDLDPATGHVYYENRNGHLIVQFSGVQRYDASGSATAQVILSLNGSITYQYLNFSEGFTTDNCTVGIENRNGSDGLEVVFNHTYLHDSLAIQFSNINWVKLSPKKGVLSPGASQIVQLTASSKDLTAATYHTYLSIAHNDEDKNPFELPVTLTVDAQLVEFSVDMVHYIDAGLFQPDLGDEVNLVGTFNQWHVDPLISFTSSGNSVYTAEVPIYQNVGNIIEYRYQYTSGDGRPLFGSGQEDSIDTATGNRQFMVTGGDIKLPTVFFNDNDQGFPAIVVTPDSIQVTLSEGDSTSVQETIQNSGSGDLNWLLSLQAFTQNQSRLHPNGTPGRLPLHPDFAPKTALKMDSPEDAIFRPPTVFHQGFYDDFEAGHLNQWAQDTISNHIYSITDELAAEGQHSLKLEGESYWYSDGVYAKFLDTSPSTISFHVYPTTTDLHACVFIGDDFLDYDGGFFECISYESQFLIYTGALDYITIPHQLNQWYFIELRNIDFISQIYDLYVDDTLVQANVSFAPTGYTSINTILLFNYDYYTTSYFDAIYVDDKPMKPWLTYAPENGRIDGFGQQSFDVQVNATDLRTGTYERNLYLHSNDPNTPDLTLPVTVTVEMKDPPIVSVTPDSVTLQTFEGDSTETSIFISNSGIRDLDWQLKYTVTRTDRQVYTLQAPVPREVTDPETGAEYTLYPKRKQAIQAALSDLTGLKILWDMSHGQSSSSGWTTLINDLTQRGARLDENVESLTSTLLQDYHILWLIDCYSGFSAEELTAIRQWISGGGHVVLEGDNSGTVTVYNELLDHLNVGIRYVAEYGQDGITNNIYPHAMTQDIHQISIGAILAQLSVESSATLLIEDALNAPMTACASLGGGIVFAMADELFNNNIIYEAQNQVFANQVFDWLATSATFLSIFPNSGSVPQDSTDQVLIKLNAENQTFGRYDLKMTITSNDPAQSSVDVAGRAHIQMVDPPVLSFSPDSLPFSLIRHDSTRAVFSMQNTGIRNLDWEIVTADQQSETAVFALSLPNDSIVVTDHAEHQTQPEPLRNYGIKGTFETLQGAKVLYDRAHGQPDYYNWSTLVSDLQLRGAIVRQNTEPFSLNSLNNYDILWITDLTQTVSSREVRAVRKWVTGGGHLLLEGDADTSLPSFNRILDALFSGIQFQEDDGTTGKTTLINPHEMTADVETVDLYYNLARLSVLDSPARWLVKDTEGIVNTAYSMTGKGRIVAMADELTDDFHIGYADNQILANQIYDWLYKGTRNWLTLTPDSGSIVSGNTHEIKLTLNTGELSDSLYRSDLMIRTNDPERLTCSIPVHLLLNQGAPADIAVSTDSIGLACEACDSLDQSFTIRNNGGDPLNWSIRLTDRVDSVISPLSSASFFQQDKWPDSGSLDSDSLSTYLDILAWTAYADINEEYLHMTQVMENRLSDYRLSNTSTLIANTLDSLLTDKDVLLIPEQEMATDNTLLYLSSMWNSVILPFVANGGVLVCCAPDEAGMDLLKSSSLMDITFTERITGGQLVKSAPSFLARDVADTISAPNSTVLFNTEDSLLQIVYAHEKGAAVALNRIEQGSVIVMGFDFYAYDSSSARLLAQALQTQALSSWLRVAPLAGTVPGDSMVTVRVRVADPNLLNVGDNKKYLHIQHNDYLTDDLFIPILVQFNMDHTAVMLQQGVLPTVFKLEQNFPNPFNPRTTIQYQLPRTSQVSITIYDVLGRKVYELVNRRQKAGYYQVVWEGQNRSGGTVTSGIYLYKIDADGFRDIRKMMFLK